MTVPGAEPSSTPPGEQGLRAELEQVRTQVVDLWDDGDDATGREYLATIVGTLALFLGLLFFGVGAFPVDGYADYGRQDAGFLAAGLLLLTAAGRAFRSPVMRRVLIYREVRRLRRRERELAAMLPAGTAGPNSYRRYYGQRFGNPSLLVLYAFMFVVLLLVLFS